MNVQRQWLRKVGLVVAISFILAGCEGTKSVDVSEPIVTGKVSEIDFNFVKGNFEDTYAQETIETLSSELYDGRLVGTEGNTLAQDYIIGKFKEIGLESPEDVEGFKQLYTQKTIINSKTPVFKTIDQEGQITNSFKFGETFRVVSLFRDLKVNGTAEGEITVINALSELSKENTELDGKILIVKNDLLGENPNAVYDLYQSVLNLKQDIRGIVILKDNRNTSTYIVSTALGYIQPKSNQEDFDNENGPVLLYCIDTVYEALVEAEKNGDKVEIKVNYDYKEVEAANLIGVIKGKDDTLKDEYVLVTAHYDHVGNNGDGTYNPGALDNASGVAGLLEIAKIMKSNEIQPDKTIVFIAFSGEEEGFFGSINYVKYPIYDLKKSKVINLDMIGSKSELPLTLVSRFKTTKNELKAFADLLEIPVELDSDMACDQIPFTTSGYDAVTLIQDDVTQIHTIFDDVSNVDVTRMHDPIELTLYYMDQEAFQKQ